jgi:hypothetical protein
MNSDTPTEPAPASTRSIAPKLTGEVTISVRLYAAREIALGLLLRDSNIAIVVRALRTLPRVEIQGLERLD